MEFCSGPSPQLPVSSEPAPECFKQPVWPGHPRADHSGDRSLNFQNVPIQCRPACSPCITLPNTCSGWLWVKHCFPHSRYSSWWISGSARPAVVSGRVGSPFLGRTRIYGGWNPYPGHLEASPLAPSNTLILARDGACQGKLPTSLPHT